MISVEEALKLVLEHKLAFSMESIPLEAALGRILAEPIYADRDFPPFDRVCMDGIAIAYDSFEQGRRLFKIESEGAAGQAQKTLKDANNCIEVMTGAPRPIGTDAVIRYEDLNRLEDSFQVEVEPQQGKNIHVQGRDQKKGSILLKKGQMIKPIDINVLATCGKSQVQVVKNPNVAIIASGEELVSIETEPEPHQIRMSNAPMIKAHLSLLGLNATIFHVLDSKHLVETELRQILNDYDVLILSGGVSAGKYDLIPKALEGLGLTKVFHKVRQRPGKPFFFGSSDTKRAFAFPGNPVSGLVCLLKYFVPWYRASLGLKHDSSLRVKLEENTHFKAPLTTFAQATLHQTDDGQLLARVVRGNGSGDMVSPTQVDGFIELPYGRDNYLAGEFYDFYPFQNIDIQSIK